MSVQFIVIAVAVVICAAALLGAADYKSSAKTPLKFKFV
jgi:hypothetical protein